jgi:hypothetical protein
MSLANLRFPCSSWMDIFFLFCYGMKYENDFSISVVFGCWGISFLIITSCYPVVIYRFGASIQLELDSTDGYVPFANLAFYTICAGSILLLRAGCWQMLLDAVGWLCACAAKSFPQDVWNGRSLWVDSNQSRHRDPPLPPPKKGREMMTTSAIDQSSFPTS